MRSALLHASETWPLTKTNLQRNDRAMIRQICSIIQARGCGHGQVKWATGKAWAWGPQPHFEREKALLVWACGHVKRSSGGVSTACDVNRLMAERPKPTWKKPTERGCREWKLTTVDPQERSTWCEICYGCSASYLEEGPLMWIRCPCTCMLIKNLIWWYIKFGENLSICSWYWAETKLWRSHIQMESDNPNPI